MTQRLRNDDSGTRDATTAGCLFRCRGGAACAAAANSLIQSPFFLCAAATEEVPPRACMHALQLTIAALGSLKMAC